MSDDVVIRVENLWKRYGTTVGAELKRLLSFRRNSQGAPVEDHGPWALRDINFEVRRGDTLGIIGRNGAGKSTLLKVLAGVTPPTYGDIEMRGRIFPMIELNAGMHMDLTGRQNVHLLGAVMGFSPQEMQDRMPPIEEFCELGEWFDRPVWMYSSGMLARLGFSVAVNVDADVLLIDEVLAVGDLAFQRKCYNRIEHLREQHITVILVSHNIRQVERLCERVALLEGGQTKAVGKAGDVLQLYVEQAHKHILTQVAQARSIPRAVGTGELRVLEAQVLNANHVPSQDLRVFEDLTIRVEFDVAKPIRKLIIAFQIYSVDMICVAAVNNMETVRPSFECGRVVVECTLSDLRLMPGVYSLRLKVRDGNEAVILSVDHLAQFRVVGESFALIRASGGLVYVNTSWRFDGSQKPELPEGTKDVCDA